MATAKTKQKNTQTPIIAALFVLLVIVTGALAYLTTTQKSGDWDQVAAISEKAIEKLDDSKWDTKVIHDQVTEPLKGWLNTNAEELKVLNKLGKLKRVTEIQLLAVDAKGEALVITNVQYENGKALVSINLKKIKGKWLIDKVNFDSPILSAKESTA